MNKKLVVFIVLIFFTGQILARQDVVYMSPEGKDRNSGKGEDKPVKSFTKAFALLDHAGTLILLDGEYSEKSGTGTPGKTAIIPGKSLTEVTLIKAKNPGKAHIQGLIQIGSANKQLSFFKLQDLKFTGGLHFYNVSYATLKSTSIHGKFGIGSNDHNMGNHHNLVEDVWVWASGERVIAQNYRANHNVWRRVVIRGDGCNKSACKGEGNPNYGLGVYNSRGVSVQNVIILDRILDGGQPYADFIVAQHDWRNSGDKTGENEWLGTLSLNSPDSGYYFEPDWNQVIDKTFRLKDAIVWDSKGPGIVIRRDGTHNIFENLTVFANGRAGIYIDEEQGGKNGVLRNALIINSGEYGVHSAYPVSHMNSSGSGKSDFEKTFCESNCSSQDGAQVLKYITRIEKGSFLSGAGFSNDSSSADIGANMVYQYGKSGSRVGDEGYNELSQEPLWPWPNEERIKQDMCETISRGMCSSKNITDYVWSYANNPLPSSFTQ